jgi:hypothetical protein
VGILAVIALRGLEVRPPAWSSSVSATGLTVACAERDGSAYRKQKQRYHLVRYERSMRLMAAVAGLGAMAFTAWWVFDPGTRVLGFPFTAAVFELHDGIGYDHVGAVTIPAMIANVILWALVPQLPITLLALLLALRKARAEEHSQHPAPANR